METYKDLTIEEINEEAAKLRSKLHSKWLTNWQRTCIEDELDDIDRELERRYRYENDYVFEKDGDYKFFPERHRAIEKFADDDWDKQWSFYCNDVDEYGDTYEIWIDGDGDFRWDVIEEEEDDEDDWEDYYTPSATHGDYSPSCPWNAPGMSISDFI